MSILSALKASNYPSPPTPPDFPLESSSPISTPSPEPENTWVLLKSGVVVGEIYPKLGTWKLRDLAVKYKLIKVTETREKLGKKFIAQIDQFAWDSGSTKTAFKRLKCLMVLSQEAGSFYQKTGRVSEKVFTDLLASQKEEMKNTPPQTTPSTPSPVTTDCKTPCTLT
jgi:hypothetical protein